MYVDIANYGRAENMPELTLRIDVTLRKQLIDAGLDLEEICSTALQAEAVRVQAERADGDDATLYQRGFEAGSGWASNVASQRELAEITQWSGIRWHQFSLVPRQNSFTFAYCEAVRLDYPRRDEPFFFTSNAFTRGMVEGAIAINGANSES